MRNVIQFNLENAGYDVCPCVDGQEALTAAQSEAFQLIVSDQFMPKMNGNELCDKLRTMDQYQSAPMILVSGGPLDWNCEALAEALGVTAVLRKPFSPSVLVKMADELLIDSTV